MKKSSILPVLFSMFFIFSGFLAQGEVITTTFKVNGECSMCKKKIETSLRVKGINKVNWDIKSHELTVTYNSEKITLDEIHKRVASVGYDTEKIKATDEAYSQLHGCCKYDRTKL